MAGRFAKQTVQKVIARVFAAVLLFVWFGQVFPTHIAVKAFDEPCKLACCKRLARHSAKSCASGTCHFHPVKKPQTEEILCGAKKKGDANNQNTLEGVLIVDETHSNNSQDANGLPSAQMRSVHKSCQTNCCAASFSAGQQNRTAHEKTALASFADKPRPPTVVEIEFFNFVAVKTAQIIFIDAPSRAPPVSFS